MIDRSRVRTLNSERDLTPFEIVHHEFFTRAEKLERLREMKAETTGAIENDEGLGYTADEVERAMDELQAQASEEDELKGVISDRAAGR